jgi:NAD+ kinase
VLKLKKIGIFGSNYQAGKQKSIQLLLDKIQNSDGKIWMESRFYDYLSGQLAFKPKVEGLIDSKICPLDMVISLGGDGTFLRTATWIGRQNIPILGINTGRLGFLADIHADEIEPTLDEIFRGEFVMDERSMLELTTTRSSNEHYNYALNDIAILKRDTSAMIDILAYLNDEYLTNYLADGLLVATPTGSTAYSLSVNGPIIIPQANNFVLTPIAPHSLNVRPLVIPEDYTIRLKVESRNRNFLVSLDGRSEVYPSGSEFLIKKADFKIKIIKRLSQSFYDTLRKKLLWGTDIRKS